jgi:hypothetical protein
MQVRHNRPDIGQNFAERAKFFAPAAKASG